jgi:putative transposase
MQLTHKIALTPTVEQEAYFRRAAGCARFVWNAALAEWNRQDAAGGRPNAMAMKRAFNHTKYQVFPWLAEIHRDAHAQPFAHLAKAWARFFADLAAGARVAPTDRAARRRLRARGIKLAYTPTFKKKGQARDSFYVANDKCALVDDQGQPAIRLPKVGLVRLTERLRFGGKILGVTVSRTAARWFVALQLEVPETLARQPRVADGVEGVDLGLKAAATLASGEAVAAPKPLRRALRRLRIHSRRLSRKVEAAKRRLGQPKQAMTPKGVRLLRSANRRKAAERLAALYARVANLRADFTHKLTTRLCRENQALGLEDLCVHGMLANDRLARAVSDVGFYEIRRQLAYKARRYGTQVVVADRFYPSSKTCSRCGAVLDALPLSVRAWVCPACGASHDRDHNAACNLRNLAILALPVASRPVTDGTALVLSTGGGGKVTPVRYECVQQAPSGQEAEYVYFCAHS